MLQGRTGAQRRRVHWSGAETLAPEGVKPPEDASRSDSARDAHARVSARGTMRLFGRRPAVGITAGRSRAPPTTVAYNAITPGDGPRGRGGAVAAPNNSITYILPDEGWAPLLDIIVREAPSGSVIEVNTAGMATLAARMLQEVGRQDVTVALCPPRGRAPAHGAGPADRPPERL